MTGTVFKLTIAKCAQAMLLLFVDERLKIKQCQITSKTKTDRYFIH